jgi:hypothetical protein
MIDNNTIAFTTDVPETLKEATEYIGKNIILHKTIILESANVDVMDDLATVLVDVLLLKHTVDSFPKDDAAREVIHELCDDFEIPKDVIEKAYWLLTKVLTETLELISVTEIIEPLSYSCMSVTNSTMVIYGSEL